MLYSAIQYVAFWKGWNGWITMPTIISFVYGNTQGHEVLIAFPVLYQSSRNVIRCKLLLIRNEFPLKYNQLTDLTSKRFESYLYNTLQKIEPLQLMLMPYFILSYLRETA